MRKAINPFRLARTYLARDYFNKSSSERYSVISALYCLSIMAPLKSREKEAARVALNHAKEMVLPQYNDRSWLEHCAKVTIVDGQQLQDWRNAWLDHMAKQWDEGEIK